MSKASFLIRFAGIGAIMTVFTLGSLRADVLKSTLPSDYVHRHACEKQRFLWEERILPSQHLARQEALPPFQKLNIFKLLTTHLAKKMDVESDEVPEGWKKAIHPVGVVAKVQFVAEQDTPFTGLFRGAECGLIRLSLTDDPEDRGVAPGLGLKLFVDGQSSQNFSALVSLDGQGQNYNFFAHEFSNIIPRSKNLGPRLVNWLFRQVSRHPTRLYLKGLAERGQQGRFEPVPRFPYRIYLSPTQAVQFDEKPKRDVRMDLIGIPPGTILFDVFAVVPEEGDSHDMYSDESASKEAAFAASSEYRKRARRIGRIVTTSEFVSSEYGNERLFFRHQRYANE